MPGTGIATSAMITTVWRPTDIPAQARQRAGMLSRDRSPKGHNCPNSVDDPSRDSIAWHTLSDREHGEGDMGVMLRTRIAARLGRARRAAVLGAAVLSRAGSPSRSPRRRARSRSRASARCRPRSTPSPAQFNKANQQYDQVEEQLAAAKARLQAGEQAAGPRPEAVRGGAQAGRADRRLLLRGLRLDVAGGPAHLERPEPGARRGVDRPADHRDAGTWRPRRSSPTPASSPPCSRSSSAPRRASRSSPRSGKHTKDHIATPAGQAEVDTQLADRHGADGGAAGHRQRRRRHHAAPPTPGRPGPRRTGGRLRLQAARLPLQLRLDRAVQRRLRLLGPDDGGLGVGGHHDPARHLQPVGGAAAHLASSDSSPATCCSTTASATSRCTSAAA